jgi:nifR3 family TIM-barrel protein
MNFWKALKKPILVLAPMADVTDVAFRRVIAKYGKPDVMWTEFVSADGLVRASEEGKRKLLKDLEYSESERPIVAQLFGANVENMKKAAELVAKLGFDGLDINMGCPDKSIEKQGAGAAMIKNPKQAREIIRAAKEGAPNIPISVKTRIGYNKDELDSWLPEILAEGVAVVTVHARTRKEMSKVPAQWSAVGRTVKMRNEIAPDTLIIGNGDVADPDEGRMRVKETGADGVMFGRAIFGNPWLFAKRTPDIKEKLEVLVEHTKLFDELLGSTKNFSVMKKHFKSYVSGFNGAGELRASLMQTNNAKEVETMVGQFLKGL